MQQLADDRRRRSEREKDDREAHHEQQCVNESDATRRLNVIQAHPRMIAETFFCLNLFLAGFDSLKSSSKLACAAFGQSDDRCRLFEGQPKLQREEQCLSRAQYVNRFS
jgi:hypothetical protein